MISSSSFGSALTLALLFVYSARAQEYPTARIANGVISAELYLPDHEKGSYRATRFDWSGIIRGLTYKGHSYFGQWYEHHDPLIHDAITGPVNVFDTAMGYTDAKPGETFARIGVGRVEKPDETAFRETYTYKVIDPGKWSINKTPNSIRFTQELAARGGYGYTYLKIVSLTPRKPEMVLSQQLKNTGTKPIDTNVFNHGFFQIDREPAGPNLVWTFPFEPHTARDFGGMAEIRGHQVVYLRELKPGERALALLEGYSPGANDHRFVLENVKTGAGVRVAGDRPITKLTFWSRRMAYSPEASINLHIEPGDTVRWQTRYEFYARDQSK